MRLGNRRERWIADEGIARTSGLGLNIQKRHPAGCICQDCWRDEITETSAYACVPLLGLDLDKALGQCPLADSVDNAKARDTRDRILPLVDPSEIALDANHPGGVDLPVVSDIAADPHAFI